MPSNRAGSLIASPRAFAVAVVLFAFGVGAGLAGAVLMPTAAARWRGDPPPQTVAQPAVALDEAAADGCDKQSLRRRAAQVLVVGLPSVTAPVEPLVAEVTALGVGGVFINDSNVVDEVQVQALTDTLRAGSKVPPLITTDEESGRVSSFRSLIGHTSSPRTLAATRASDDVRAYAAELGLQMAQLGLNSDLAPVADLDGGPSSGVIGDRAFSADPVVVEEYALSFAEGLAEAGLLPVIKHFPGHGRSIEDVHRRQTTIDAPLEELLSTDLLPFVGLIEAGAPIVMVGHPTYTALDPERPASMAPAAYSLLRDLEFTGVAMTDSIGMGAIHRRWKFPDAAVKAVKAGADAVLATDGRHAAAMVDGLVAAVRAGDLPEQRLDEAAARMLAIKGIDPQPMTCLDAPEVPSMALDAVVAGR